MKTKFRNLWLIFFILLSVSLSAQTTNYPTKKINGVNYYIYPVQPGEGLMAIGRKFNVSVEEIKEINPDVKSALKAGQELLIPVPHKYIVTISSEKRATEFIQYKVGKKQTLFAICHKYNVSQEDIEKFNPDVKAGLREGMVLNIPDSTKIKKHKMPEKVVEQKQPSKQTEQKSTNKPVIISTPKNTSPVVKTIIHKVQPKETLYSICKQYNVDQKDVIKINPGADVKISVGSELKIPVRTETEKPKKETLNKTESIIQPINELKKEPVTETYRDDVQKKNIRIAFLLPFMTEQTKKETALERFQNFYAGALIAVKKAKENGISFEIYTYDTDKTEEKITELLNIPDLKSMDLIIGPAFSNQVPQLASFAKENKVMTLIPFSSKIADIETNPYLFQFNPGSETEIKYLANQFKDKWNNVYPVFAEIQGISQMDEGKIKVEELKKELKKMHKSFGMIEFNSTENIDYSVSLKKNMSNLIIFNSDKYANVNPYLNSLLMASTSFKITLFEQYSWRTQLDKKPDCVYISPFQKDLTELEMIDYNASFDHFYGKDVTNDSPRYDLLGYDLTNYFVSYISNYGNNFCRKLGSIHSIHGLQSQLDFEKTNEQSGYINQKLYTTEIKNQ